MKFDDYVEHRTKNGFLLRINMRNGTFLAFMNGKPHGWVTAGVETQIHPMLHAIFLGEKFRVQTRQDSPLIFFPMERSFVKIPFAYGDEGEERFMRIPTEYEGLDFLPGLAFHFPSYWPNVLPAIGDGRRYFITDQEIPRQNIMRLKGKYPRSRLIIFKPEDFMKIRVEREKIEEQGKGRAIDLVETMNDDAIEQNPVFAARYFLRSLDWRKMYSIPMFTRVAANEVEIIESFLEKMYKSAPTNEELRNSIPVISDLVDYYDGVAAVISGEFARVKSWQRKHQVYKRVVLSNIIATCEFQRKFALLDKNVPYSALLRDVAQALRDVPAHMITS